MVFAADSADIRAVHAEGNAPTLRDANAPFVGARPVEAVQPIGRSRQRAQRLRAVQRCQDRLQSPDMRWINASGIVAAVQPLDCAPREALYRQESSILTRHVMIPQAEAAETAIHWL